MKTIKRIAIFSLCFVFLISLSSSLTENENSKKQCPKTEKELPKTIKLFFDVDLPEHLIPASVEIQYRLGYGRKKIEEVLKTDTVKLELKSEQRTKVELDFINREKLDFSMRLQFEYIVLIKIVSTNQLFKGGGWNGHLLEPLKNMKRLGLYVTYDTGTESVSCRPIYEQK